jgi:hypothetical protein
VIESVTGERYTPPADAARVEVDVGRQARLEVPLR